MKPSKKHSEVIRAWLDGKQVQYHNGVDRWFDDDEPAFEEYVDYRVKPAEPERGYPKCQMPEGAIWQYWVAACLGAENETAAIKAMIEIGMQCECDAGQIVTREEFDRAVGDRKARDLAIAVAVSNAHRDGTVAYLTLADIIKGVTQ